MYQPPAWHGVPPSRAGDPALAPAPAGDRGLGGSLSPPEDNDQDDLTFEAPRLAWAAFGHYKEAPEEAPPEPARARIAIFKVGSHTAANGQTRRYTADDLKAMVAAYDPALFDAPLVLGHPADNDPAYGWVERLEVKGELLYAHCRDLDPRLVRDVRAGRYRKISASFFTPASPHNPCSGAFYLRHVGFLGAATPAVRELPPVDLAAPVCPTDCLTDPEPEGVHAMPDTPTPTPADADLEEIARLRAELEAKDQLLTASHAEATAAQTARDQFEAELARIRTQARHAANLAYTDGLISQGRLPAQAKEVVVAVLDALEQMSPAVSFAVDEGLALPLDHALRACLAALPPAVPLGEIAHAEATPGPRSLTELSGPEATALYQRDPETFRALTNAQ